MGCAQRAAASGAVSGALSDTELGVAASVLVFSAGVLVVTSADSAAGLMVFIDFMVIAGKRRIACWLAQVRCQSCDFRGSGHSGRGARVPGCTIG